MNAASIIEWVKANVFIVVFVALMIAAPVAMFIVSSGMNETVRADVAKRAQKISDLKRVETGQITTPDGRSVQGVLNDAFLQRYMQVANIMNDDAVAVQRAAIEHNRKGRGVVMERVLPEMPPDQRDVLPARFHEALVAAYGKLLTEVNAGVPPALESMREELTRSRTMFITQNLRKTATDQLTAEESTALANELSKLRMANYAMAADKILLYCSTNELAVPGFDRTRQPTSGEMFAWQWQLWITQDVLKALASANTSDRAVNRAPVKQVLSIVVQGLPSGEEGGSSNSGGSVGEGDGAQPDAGSTGAAPPNPKVPAPKDFSQSVTGRVTNPLYDVIPVSLDLIVESGRLPHVLDALARYNFMTVTSMELSAADPFEAAQSGYFYGSEPVTAVHLELETIWLREWTRQYMPESVKKELGVSADAPASASANSPPAA